MSSCVEHPSVVGILLYCGNELDSAINWSLCVITTLSVVISTRQQLRRGWHLTWIPLLLFLFLFQVGLCFLEKCTGVSVVWSAMVGFQTALHATLLYVGAQPPDLTMILLWAATLLACVATWAYYAVTAAPITSVAHLCAVVMGAVIAVVLAIAYVQTALARNTHGVPHRPSGKPYKYSPTPAPRQYSPPSKRRSSTTSVGDGSVARSLLAPA